MVHLLIITIQLIFSLLIPSSVFVSNHSQPRKYNSRTENSLARRLFPKRMILHPRPFDYVIGCQKSEVQQFGLLYCILWILQKAPEYMIGGNNPPSIIPVVIMMTEKCWRHFPTQHISPIFIRAYSQELLAFLLE